MPRRDVTAEALAKLAATNPTLLKSSAKMLGDWLADPELLRAPRVVLPRLAVEGRVTLLSGREKIGKSTLIGGAVADASRGLPVLGEPINE